jgi:hypothetical protein
MMSFLLISFSASAAGRAFILTGAYNKMSSSETEGTASDMSDLSYEQEFGELEEGYLAPRLTKECPSLSIATP